MNDSTGTTPTDRARRVAELIGTSATPDVYMYCALKLAAEDVVANPTELHLGELAAVLAGIDLHGARQLDALAATIAAIEADRAGGVR